MKRIRMKSILFLSLIFGCFINFSGSFFKEEKDLLFTNAKQDYINLNFEKNPNNNSLPSGYIVTDSSGNDTTPAFDSEGRFCVSNGGSSSFSFDTKRPHGKRTTRFTLYEDTIVEIGIYTTGSSKEFIIHDGTSELYRQLAEKSTTVYFQYKFTDVPESGKVYYFGGSSSSIYVDSIYFGTNERVRFDANGGIFNDGTTFYSYEKPESGDTKITAPSDPTNGDNIFLGWSETKGGSTPVSSFEYNKIYYAIWKSASEIQFYFEDLSISLDLENNKTKKLVINTLPDKNMVDKMTFTWKSLNEKVATVDNTGLVTAVSLGDTTITATYKNKTISCNVHVIRDVEHEVIFYADYEKFLSGEEEYGSVTVNNRESLGNENKPTINFGAGYDVSWKYDVNNTPENKADDIAYDFNSAVTSDIKIYAEKVILPLANILEISIPESFKGIETSKRHYYLSSSNESFSFNIKYDRDDGRLNDVKDLEFFKENISDVSWYSSDESIAKVDKTTGAVTILKNGKFEIYAKMYENLPTKYGEEYERHILVASSIYISTLSEKIVDNKKIDTSIGIKVETGRFQSLGDSEKAIRFIGYISEDFFPYISMAKFKVEAINEKNEVQREFSYDVETFSEKIEYTSKTPYISSYFKPWSMKGKVGTAFTITGLPTNEFVGYFKVTFMVEDADSEIVLANVSTKEYIGI